MKSKLYLPILLFAAAVLLSGCITIGSGANKNNQVLNDGGIYRSTNKGNTWLQKTLVPTASGKPASFGAFDAYALVRDPSDNKALYLAAIGEGLIYSYDGAETWQRANTLGKMTIRSIAIDPSSKCVIYVSSTNKVYKTTDCSRSWTQVFYDNDPRINMEAIAIDFKNPKIVFVGTSKGDVIRSLDSGDSWQPVERFKSRVLRVMISPHDNRLMFVATERNGLFRSADGGITWTALDQAMKQFKNSSSFKDLEFSGVSSSTLFYASSYGLLKSADNGTSWSAIELLTAEAGATINALAVDPKDDKLIYYVTNTTFYKTVDGGANWITKKLPTTRVGWTLLIDPVDTNIIYMGVRNLQKK